MNLKNIGIGIFIAICGAFISYWGMLLNVKFWPWISFGLLAVYIISKIIHYIIVWRILEEDRKKGRIVCYCMSSLSPFGAIAAIFGIMCAVWALPALIIYWTLNPESPKRAIKICALLIGIAFSILYFLANREKFPSIADKVTFFTGVI